MWIQVAKISEVAKGTKLKLSWHADEAAELNQNIMTRTTTALRYRAEIFK